MACSLCHDPRAEAFSCPDCFHENLRLQREELRDIRRRNERLAERLGRVLEIQARRRRREALVRSIRERIEFVKAQHADIERQLRLARFERQSLAQGGAERIRALRRAEGQLARDDQRRRAEHAARSHGAIAVELSRLQRQVLDQQTSKLAHVRALFPMHVVRLGGEDCDADEETATYICSLPLPMPLDDAMRLTRQSPQSGALGYLALLLKIVSQILAVPALARSSFQGSTTKVWAPGGWWDAEAHPPDDALTVQHRGPEPGGFVAGMLAAAGGGDEATETEAALRDAADRAAEAVALLSRVAGALCYAACGGAVPASYGAMPFSWLASLLDELGGGGPGSGGGGGAGAASGARGGSRRARGLGLGRGAAEGGPRLPHVALAASTWGGAAGGAADDGETEGWEIMPRPSYGRLIPPPPSASDDVEHWMHAMYGAPSPAGGAADPSPSAAARAVGAAMSAQAWVAQRFRQR